MTPAWWQLTTRGWQLALRLWNALTRDDDAVAIFVVYEDASDFPGRVVVRRHRIADYQLVPDALPLFIGDDIPAARHWLRTTHPELHNVGRAKIDNSAVVENWI